MTDPRSAPHEMPDSDTTRCTPTNGEDLREGGTWLLDVVAAIDHLTRGHRHGITVWDALEEAIRWWIAEQLSAADGVADPELADLPWDAPDPLRATLQRLLNMAPDSSPPDVSNAMHQAVRRWTQTMASLYNDGHAWPHPMARRAFPTPILPVADDSS